MRHITGGCHCGNVTFDLHVPVSGATIPVRACSCTFCRKHGGVYTSHPDARLEARIAERDEVNRYQFGHRTAEFYVCRRCGAVPCVMHERYSTLKPMIRSVLKETTLAELAASAARR